MPDLQPPNICIKCGGEKPSKENKYPAAPCICDENTDNMEID